MKEEYQELIRLLRDENNCNVLDYVDDAADAIEKLEAKTMNKWIRTKNRLPEVFVSVLVYMPMDNILPQVYEGYLRPDGKWYAASFERESDEITHWMPMPEPPEEG